MMMNGLSGQVERMAAESAAADIVERQAQADVQFEENGPLKTIVELLDVRDMDEVTRERFLEKLVEWDESMMNKRLEQLPNEMDLTDFGEFSDLVTTVEDVERKFEELDRNRDVDDLQSEMNDVEGQASDNKDNIEDHEDRIDDLAEKALPELTGQIEALESLRDRGFFGRLKWLTLGK